MDGDLSGDNCCCVSGEDDKRSPFQNPETQKEKDTAEGRKAPELSRGVKGEVFRHKVSLAIPSLCPRRLNMWIEGLLLVPAVCHSFEDTT